MCIFIYLPLRATNAEPDKHQHPFPPRARSPGVCERRSNTIQYNTIQYNTIQYNTIQYNTTLCYNIIYNTMLYYDIGERGPRV